MQVMDAVVNLNIATLLQENFMTSLQQPSNLTYHNTHRTLEARVGEILTCMYVCNMTKREMLTRSAQFLKI